MTTTLIWASHPIIPIPMRQDDRIGTIMERFHVDPIEWNEGYRTPSRIGTTGTRIAFAVPTKDVFRFVAELRAAGFRAGCGVAP
jgi:hypothetical protein